MAVGGVGVESVSGEGCLTKRTHPGCGERFLLGLVETPIHFQKCLLGVDVASVFSDVFLNICLHEMFNSRVRAEGRLGYLRDT